MIIFNNLEAIRMISRATNVPFIKDVHQCIATTNSRGELLGGILVTDFNGASCQLHIAGYRNFLNKDILYLIFDYCFNILGVRKILGIVPATNIRALKLDMHFGFEVEARIEDVFSGPCAAVVLSMTRDQCRFLNPPASWRQKWKPTKH